MSNHKKSANPYTHSRFLFRFSAFNHERGLLRSFHDGELIQPKICFIVHLLNMQASQRALRVLCPRVQVRSFSRSSARLEKAVAGARVAQNYFNDEVREALANPPAPSNPGEKYSFAIGSGMRELPSNEEIEAHFGHLLLPENTVANGLSLEVNALQNVNVLKCLAEFNSTEYQLKFPEKRVIQPDLSLGVELFQIYGNQLQNFENNTLPALQADGVPKVTQDLLHSIYKFRADTPVPEIATHILEIGINRLKMFNQEYVFRKSLYEPILGPLGKPCPSFSFPLTS